MKCKDCKYLKCSERHEGKNGGFYVIEYRKNFPSEFLEILKNANESYILKHKFYECPIMDMNGVHILIDDIDSECKCIYKYIEEQLIGE